MRHEGPRKGPFVVQGAWAPADYLIETLMIALHRLAHADEPFYLNPDLVVSVEAHPDTVVSLTTGTKVLVLESPQHIAEAIRQWRASVLGLALHELPRRSGALSLVRAAAGESKPLPVGRD